MALTLTMTFNLFKHRDDDTINIQDQNIGFSLTISFIVFITYLDHPNLSASGTVILRTPSLLSSTRTLDPAK